MKNPALATVWTHTDQLPLAHNRRSADRFGVEFRTLVSDKSGINDQVGMILDLSLSGCQVRVPIMVYPTLAMELRIYAPVLDRPIFVERAVVQWVKGDRFGLLFSVVQKAELIRLGRVIASLAEEDQEYSQA